MRLHNNSFIFEPVTFATYLRLLFFHKYLGCSSEFKNNFGKYDAAFPKTPKCTLF